MNWSTIIGVFIGGLFTLAGGLLQVLLSDKRRKEEKIKELKLKVLEDLMGHRAALVSNPSRNMEMHRERFFSALNRIDVTFSDSKEVVKKYREWQNAKSSTQPISSDRMDQILYEVIKSIYKNLNIDAPSLEQFKQTFY